MAHSSRLICKSQVQLMLANGYSEETTWLSQQRALRASCASQRQTPSSLCLRQVHQRSSPASHSLQILLLPSLRRTEGVARISRIADSKSSIAQRSRATLLLSCSIKMIDPHGSARSPLRACSWSAAQREPLWKMISQEISLAALGWWTRMRVSLSCTRWNTSRSKRPRCSRTAQKTLREGGGTGALPRHRSEGRRHRYGHDMGHDQCLRLRWRHHCTKHGRADPAELSAQNRALRQRLRRVNLWIL